MVDLDKLPVYELQTLYYLVWKEKEEEEKMTEDQKTAKALGQVLDGAM